MTGDECAYACASTLGGSSSISTEFTTNFRMAIYNQDQHVFAYAPKFIGGSAQAVKPLNGGNVVTYGGATAATYNLTNAGEWGVSFKDYYIAMIKGEAKCSSRGGSNNSSAYTNIYSDWTVSDSD